RRAAAPGSSDLRDLRDEAPLVLDVRVPLLERLLELVELVPAPFEPHWLRRLRADAVLVPGEVPRDGDRQLAGGPRERHDARTRLAEALRDPADGAAIGGAVEEVGRLEQRELVGGEPAEDRLRRRERLAVLATEAEQVAEAAAAPAPVARDHRRRRRALLQPAVLDRDLLAERAHVDELRAFLGRVADGALAHQERALADGADAHRRDLGHAHGADYSPGVAKDEHGALMSTYMCVLHLVTP